MVALLLVKLGRTELINGHHFWALMRDSQFSYVGNPMRPVRQVDRSLTATIPARFGNTASNASCNS